ncbi:hypothetical protein IY145_17800 [Methylosinus sp. H3A]|uniref:hypothetical protein n=1 Tax=Methylosinus sp. H3A TaxID=2785786 RepID=UPI0018C2F45D|nr:hypothetical protein [Methylosinus sp. H3A]MBG0811213.1 hypothetical protein [Methylosinus sp. H3A]
MSDALKMLVTALADEGARLTLDDTGEDILLDFDEGALAPSADLLSLVRSHKAEIVEALCEAAAPPPAEPQAAAEPPPEPAKIATEPEPPPIYVSIGGKRQLLEVAKIVAPKPRGPELPRAIPVSDVEPSDLDEEERERWNRARERRQGMTHQDAVLFEARLAFGDVRAWSEWIGRR